MAQRKMGLVERFTLGAEKSEGYARSTLPSNRWELFWDIFKGSFGKLVFVNILVLLFFIPLFGLIFFRYVSFVSYGTNYPFSQCFGLGYLAPVSAVGFEETIGLNVNITVFAFLPIAMAIAGVGLAGGLYVIRNMIWTEGVFVAGDFWHGIKENIRQILTVCVVYAFVLYLAFLSIALCDKALVTQTKALWIFKVSKILAYCVIVFTTMIALHMMSMSITYSLTFWQLLKNAYIFTIGLLPQSIVFLAIALIPFALLLVGNIVLFVAIILCLLVGFSFFFLVWTSFTQWAFDKFINDKIPGAKKNRGIYKKENSQDPEAVKKYRQQIIMNSSSKLIKTPIKPITDDELQLAELPQSFNRADIEKLNKSRQEIYDDNAKYVSEHKAEYEAFEEKIKEDNIDEQKEREKRIEQAKRELAKRKRNK